MELLEVQELKRQMDEKIIKEIKSFQEKTGLLVKGIYFHNGAEMKCMGDAKFTITDSFEFETRVDL